VDHPSEIHRINGVVCITIIYKCIARSRCCFFGQKGSKKDGKVGAVDGNSRGRVGVCLTKRRKPGARQKLGGCKSRSR
jgi:hypothetical protein